ncbi:hypothetical protein [Desulfotalea psychrophila]|uniref:hypothetical protein n=1 Tax=Desulfotalea psychrophila TaxID=84980 RepID=UPI0002FB4658|nr:hypothetical protein [Desulfotalea psychrophila]
MNLFEFPERELCSKCFEKLHATNAEKNGASTAVKKERPCACSQVPADALLRCENGKMSITTQDGVALWSGEMDSAHQMQTILQQVGRIHSIRNKRKKSQK